MKQYKKSILFALTFLALLVLILDSDAAAYGVQQGIDLCIKTLVPALFPFLIITGFFGELMGNRQVPLLKFVLKPCKIPPGAETIFLAGLVGGYPIGAKLVYEAYQSERITKQDAQRMLMFCNNTGPSFIFGVLGPMFSEKWLPWVIWLLHAGSAYLVGILTAVPSGKYNANKELTSYNFTQNIPNAVKTMGTICGWVIIFRILLVFLNKWFLRFFSQPLYVLLSGFLELSNGCIEIYGIESENIRFALSLMLISFGGLCVTMQTASIVRCLSIRKYISGKLLQCSITTQFLFIFLILRMDLSYSFLLIPIFLLLVILYIFKKR